MTQNEISELNNDNSRIFDEPDAHLKEKIVMFEYKNYLISEDLTYAQMNKKTNLLLYVIETGPNPYIYYLMNKINNIITLPTLYLKNIKHAHDYMRDKFEKSKYIYKGCIEYNNENYLLYEMKLHDSGMIPIYNKDSWWKVLPFEIIYSKKVLDFKMDSLTTSFFINHPNLLYLFNNYSKYEVPIVVYIGTGQSLINNYILLDENYKNGKYGKGYYFTSLEEAYFHSLYDDLEPTDTLLKLINNKYINDLTPIAERDIKIKGNKFYLNDIFIGDIPSNCNNNKFTLHNYNEDYIFLKSSKSLKSCKNKRNEYIKRNEDGCILKFVLFLKNSKTVIHKKGKNYDSYCSGKMKDNWFPTYMTKNNMFECISYHVLDKDNTIEIEFMEKKNKNITIKIK
jgi:hypothetical protein